EPDTLREVLRECSWVIKKVKLNGDDVDRLLGYEFNFHAEGMVTLSNESNTSEGEWAITTNAQGRLVMAITMGDEPGVSFEWLLSDLRDKRLKFNIEDTQYELILERVCDDNSDDDDVAEIRNIMMGGEWLVAKYTEGDKDETQNYAAFTFAFQAQLSVSVTTGETGPSYPGLWRIIRDSEGELKCYLNFGLATAMQVLMDDWKIVSATTDRIELKMVNENNVEILVFEKK
ncbi:MAG: hypothetical protein HKM92_08615, partial [Arenibacter sp.]|nr:hypothetical protein [Arenibacter sp.]